jgi:hypothetical protein
MNAVIMPPDWPSHHPIELPRNPPIDPQIFPMLIVFAPRENRQ